jgi:hypothetical protein
MVGQVILMGPNMDAVAHRVPVVQKEQLPVLPDWQPMEHRLPEEEVVEPVPVELAEFMVVVMVVLMHTVAVAVAVDISVAVVARVMVRVLIPVMVVVAQVM